MEPFVSQNKAILTIDSWMKQFPGLLAGMTTKHGGYSDGEYQTLNMGFHVGDKAETVCANRTHVASLLDFPLNSWAGAEQTHDINIKKVDKTDCGRGAARYADSFMCTDGFYTKSEGILLTLNFADCVPLFFVAPMHQMAGIAHAGWKGTVHKIAEQMIKAWGREGIAPDQIFVTIGPSICEKCYIVDRHVMNFVENILEDADELPYNLIKTSQYSLNLKQLNQIILTGAGVPKQNIAISRFCSSCDNKFFSHRRDQGKTGRMMGFIGWKETAEVYEGTSKT